MKTYSAVTRAKVVVRTMTALPYDVVQQEKNVVMVIVVQQENNVVVILKVSVVRQTSVAVQL